MVLYIDADTGERIRDLQGLELMLERDNKDRKKDSYSDWYMQAGPQEIAMIGGMVNRIFYNNYQNIAEKCKSDESYQSYFIQEMDNHIREHMGLHSMIKNSLIKHAISKAPSFEEIKRRAEIEKIAQRVRAPEVYSLNDEELKTLSDPNVDVIAARCYLLLKYLMVNTNIPDSPDRTFRQTTEEIARKYVKEKFGIEMQASLDAVCDILMPQLEDAQRQQLIQIVETGKAKKNFLLGKVYKTVSISGLMDRLDPIMATTMLVYGLISRKPENVRAAQEVIEKSKLEAGRKYIEASNLTREDIFKEISPYFVRLKVKDPEAAKQILDYFDRKLSIEEVSDMVAGVRSLFGQQQAFSHMEVKMQDGTHRDLFDNTRLMTCTFLPSGIYKEVSFLYHQDPDIGLLHVAPRDIDERLEPVGVAILVNAFDSNGKRWLVVDSVEGGTDLQRIRESVWKPAFHDSIMGVAHDVRARNVMFNDKVFNGRSRAFLESVGKNHQRATVELRKAGQTDYSSLGLPERSVKEAFESWKDGATKGPVEGFVAEVRR